VTLWLGAVSCFLMAKSYVIVWMILWVAAISLFLMGVVEGLDGAHDSHKGSGPQMRPTTPTRALEGLNAEPVPPPGDGLHYSRGK
jgi:hypothetical protein